MITIEQLQDLARAAAKARENERITFRQRGIGSADAHDRVAHDVATIEAQAAEERYSKALKQYALQLQS